MAAELIYAPLTTGAMREAAQLWAQARNAGRPTDDPKELDGDAILAAQARVHARESGDAVVVATLNVGHLADFVDARLWNAIR